MFVLVPSIHVGVHGLFHPLIVLPPTASARNEAIIHPDAGVLNPTALCWLHASGFPVLDSKAEQTVGGT